MLVPLADVLITTTYPACLLLLYFLIGVPGGWTLASIHSEAQNTLVNGFNKDDGGSSMWIGLLDANQDGRYVWDDGTTVSQGFFFVLFFV